MTQIHPQRLVDNFLNLIQIDSESGNEKAIGEHLCEQLGELGFMVQKLPVPAEVSNGF
ncbi:MAG: peptidase M20, partial [Vibrio fluvialis]